MALQRQGRQIQGKQPARPLGLVRSTLRGARASHLVLLAGFITTGANAPDTQDGVQELGLTAVARFEVGRTGVDLHRVSGAAVLANGNIAIADGGNDRVLVLSAGGELIRELGRRGEGPGEFRSLRGIFAAGDTLVSYDDALARVSLWDSDGFPIRTVGLPKVEGRNVTLRGILSADRYLVTSSTFRGAESRVGLKLDSLAVLTVQGTTGGMAEIARRELAYSYLYAEGDRVISTTQFETPFLGTTFFAAGPDAIVVVPRARAVAEILDEDGGLVEGIRLPLDLRPFDRELMDVFVDSLVHVAGRGGGLFPGSVDRIQRVFGRGFPLPPGEHAPVIAEVRPSSEGLWLRTAVPPDEPTGTWFLIDLRERRLVGRLRLPRAWAIIGGDREGVVILLRDEDGVERVAVYGLVSPVVTQLLGRRWRTIKP